MTSQNIATNRQLEESLAKSGQFEEHELPFAFFKELKRAKGQRNAAKANLAGWEVKTDYHAQLKTELGLVDWWYTRNKWQYKGKVYTGNCPKWLQNIIKETLQND